MIQITRSQILVANPSDQMEGVLDRMAGNRVGSILIVNSGRVLGIFTERDVLCHWRSWTNQATLRRPISEFMSQPVVMLKVEDIGLAAQKMVEHHIRHLPIIDSKFNLVGVLSSRDLLPAVGAASWQPIFNVSESLAKTIHLVTPSVGTEDILQNVKPAKWGVVVWTSIERVVNGTGFEDAISRPATIVFVDLDGMNQQLRTELFKVLIKVMSKTIHPEMFFSYSSDKLSKQEEEQLQKISQKTHWNLFEKPIAIAPLVEKMRLM